MRIIIACSKSWFKLDTVIERNNEVFFVFDPSELTMEFLNKTDPSFIFFPHWNCIVSEDIFNAFECVVFHTAPLPYGRGGSPIQNLIVQGFKNAPVCAIKMTNDLDGGPIYSKIEVSLTGNLTQIFERINEAINGQISMIISNKPTPVQQVGNVHRFKRRTESDNLIPEKLSLTQIYDRIRMLDAEGYPRAYFQIGDNRIEIFSSSIDGDVILAKCKIKKCTYD